MSLIRRKPIKKIRVAEAAKMIGCSSKSIKTGAIGNFKTFRLPGKEIHNGKRNTSPLYVWAAEVELYLEKIGQ